MMRWRHPYLFPGQTNGRPREKLYISEFRGAVIDAKLFNQVNSRCNARMSSLADSGKADEQTILS